MDHVVARRLGSVPMDWKQINFKAGEIRLDPGTTKNKQGRVFLMNADLRRILSSGRQASRSTRSASSCDPDR